MCKNLFRNVYRSLIAARYRLPSLILKEIKPGWKILDAGCGRCSPLSAVKKGLYRIGLDMYEPYLYKSRISLVHDSYVLGDVRALPFKSNAFDCTIATEILEHLEKGDGVRMLEEIERVTKRKILMTTPNGFLPTYAGAEDNPDETHLCGWTMSELKKLGFRVYGLSGWKALWKVEKGKAVSKCSSEVLSHLLRDITEIFVFYCPSAAFQFMFVKEICEKQKA